MAAEGDSLYSIRAYYLNQGGGNDGMHAPINNWFYWCWNANSGDTGGIVRCCMFTAVSYTGMVLAYRAAAIVLPFTTLDNPPVVRHYGNSHEQSHPAKLHVLTHQLAHALAHSTTSMHPPP